MRQTQHQAKRDFRPQLTLYLLAHSLASPPPATTYYTIFGTNITPFNNNGIQPYYVDAAQNFIHVPMNGVVGDTFTYTFSNLTNGTAYDFYIVSFNLGALINSDGNVEYYIYYYSKSLIITATPSTIPNQVANLNATAGNSQLTLNWNAPNDGGAAITSYVINTSNSNSGPWAPLLQSASSYTSTTYPLYSLINGTTYYFQVAATNVNGTGPYNVTNAMPVGPPSAIPPISAITGNRQVTLNWTAPSNNGGSTMTYSLQYSTTGYTGWSTFAESLLASTSTYNINSLGGNNLTNGTTYYFQVTATNSIGSVYATTSAMPVGPPTGITNLNPTAGDRQVKLNWGVPLNNGGVAITGYTLQYRTSSSGQWTTLPLYTTLATLEYIIPGLTNGTTYDFQVAATNVKGTGPYTLKNETPVGPPSDITSISPTAGDSQVTLKWGVPLNNGGSVITGYKLQYSTNSGPWTTLQASALTYTVNNLTNGIRYYFQVAATNEYGTRAASTVVSAMPLTNPSIPQNFNGIGINGGVYLSWTAPSIIGALSITAYNIQYSTAPSVSWSQSYSYASSILTLPFTGLTNGTLYYFRLSAVNNEGLSSDYAVISAIPQIACQGTTIYKPNNVRFAKQGGVSSSTRTLSLRVNTVNLNGNSFYSAFGAEGANAGKYSTEYNPGYFLKNKYQPPNCKLYYGSKTGNPTVCFHLPA